MKATTLSRRLGSRRTVQNRGTASKSLKIQSVLVPIDFSTPSLQAVEFALPWLKSFGAELHLVHVFEPDYPLASTAALPLLIPNLQVRDRVRHHLKDVSKKHSVALGSENVHARRGRPFEEICRLARDRSIDLIVTSTRGNTGLKHLALGSTAERVVRYASCPVLIARGNDRRVAGNAKPKDQLSFKKILVPIDFSACSLKGLAYAKGLAKQFNASLILLHSVHPQYYVSKRRICAIRFPSSHATTRERSTRAAARSRAQDRLERNRIRQSISADWSPRRSSVYARKRLWR